LTRTEWTGCSPTAQRGALDWRPKFKKATLPVFKELYKSVMDGTETKRVMSMCGRKDYKERLDKELAAMGDSEMWKAGKACRSLRPNSKAKGITKETKGTKGRGQN
jgi:ketol-acid reductoisomerase